jgi:ribonuclease BN (tRNA processing enzyme)
VNLTVLGCSPSFPNPGGACSGYLIEAGERPILVDCGHGVAGVLLTRLDPRRLGAIVISHMHADHYFDLVPLRYAYQFVYSGGEPVPLHLPPGGKEVLQRLQAAAGLAEGFFDGPFQVREYDPERTLALAEAEVAFAPTHHFVPGFSMRFTPSGGSGPALVYTSDTGWSNAVLNVLRGASLALVEASVLTYPSGESEHGHLTPPLAGRLASEAGVERLVITHYWTGNAASTEQQASAAFGRAVELAEPGRTYRV